MDYQNAEGVASQKEGVIRGGITKRSDGGFDMKGWLPVCRITNMKPRLETVIKKPVETSQTPCEAR